MRRRSLLILPILLASICVPVRAQEETTTGTINGRVVNERGEPMVGATIFVRAAGTFAQSRSTISDTEGNFRFTGLEPALYTINGQSPAYILQPQAGNASPYYRIGDSVRLEFVKGGVITGTVTNAVGEPVVGVRVRAYRIRDAKGKASHTQYSSMERATDDRGIYRIYGLNPGSYLVTAGGGGNNQSFQFNPFEADVPIYAPSSMRDNAIEYAVRSGEETTADIRYRSDPGYTISGSVKVASNKGAWVMIVSSDEIFIPNNGFQPPGARGFAINGLGDGEYTLYAQEMSAAMPSLTAIPAISTSEPKRITIKGADVSGVELVTRPLSTIGGVVLLESSKAPECQGKRKPAFGEMLIELQRHDKDSELIAPFLSALSVNTTPDEKGAFSVRNVAPARYRFNPRFYARYWYLQSMSTAAPAAANARTAAPKNDAAANWTLVKSGEQVSNLTITLAEGAASIRGKIAVAEGETVPAGLLVYLMPAEREKAGDVLRYFVTQVAADGAFMLNNLPPGRYFTLVQNALPEDINTVLKLRLPESAEARTKLRRAAETQESDLELKPCQTLTDYRLSFK